MGLFAMVLALAPREVMMSKRCLTIDRILHRRSRPYTYRNV
jgi:hypothetical protein